MGNEIDHVIRSIELLSSTDACSPIMKMALTGVVGDLRRLACAEKLVLPNRHGYEVVDLTPAMREGAAQNRLIELGWTPPGSTAAAVPGDCVVPTYSSTQATNCAQCGEHKHTPLRIDWMGGYVCLTCIDRELESREDALELGTAILLAAGALPEGAEVHVDVERGAGTVTAYAASGASIEFDEDDCTLGEQVNNAVNALKAMLAAAESPQ